MQKLTSMLRHSWCRVIIGSAPQSCCSPLLPLCANSSTQAPRSAATSSVSMAARSAGEDVSFSISFSSDADVALVRLSLA